MRKYFGFLAATGLVTLPAVSLAAAPTLSDVLGASGIAVTGYVDGSYAYNFQKGTAMGGGLAAGRAFDASSGFLLNQAALNIGYQPAEGFGAFANVIAGNDAKAINGSYGSGSSDVALTQGYVQYATGGLTVIAGRYVTLSGFEVINDTLNTNVSRSLLFQNAEPLVHTGVRASYKFNDAITTYLGVNNSALSGDGVDENKEKTLETGVSLTPIKPVGIGVYEYYGLDGSSPSTQKSSLTDLVVTYQVIDPLQLAINADYARKSTPDDNSVPSATVWGVAGYVNYTFTSSLKGSLRAEYIKGKLGEGVVAPGGTTSTENDREVTATVDYAATGNFDLLGEVRLDGSTNQIIPNGSDPLRKTEGDVMVKAIYKFGTPTT